MKPDFKPEELIGKTIVTSSAIIIQVEGYYNYNDFLLQINNINNKYNQFIGEFKENITNLENEIKNTTPNLPYRLPENNLNYLETYNNYDDNKIIIIGKLVKTMEPCSIILDLTLFNLEWGIDATVYEWD